MGLMQDAATSDLAISIATAHGNQLTVKIGTCFVAILGRHIPWFPRSRRCTPLPILVLFAPLQISIATD